MRARYLSILCTKLSLSLNYYVHTYSTKVVFTERETAFKSTILYCGRVRSFIVESAGLRCCAYPKKISWDALFYFSIVYVVNNSPMYEMIECVCTKTNIHGT